LYKFRDIFIHLLKNDDELDENISCLKSEIEGCYLYLLEATISINIGRGVLGTSDYLAQSS
jgi:hypothetical protein